MKTAKLYIIEPMDKRQCAEHINGTSNCVAIFEVCDMIVNKLNVRVPFSEHWYASNCF